jgi:DNA-binding beta-propeller fold protein YncE
MRLLLRVTALVVCAAVTGGSCALHPLAAMPPPLGDAAARPAAQLARERHLLVSLSGDHSVALLDTATGVTVTTFPVVRGPHEIAMSRDRRFAYVANAGSGPGGAHAHSVSAIDLRTQTVRHMDVAPHEPHDVRVSRDGQRIWVAVARSRAVLDIEASTGRIERTFSMAHDGGWFVAAMPDDKKLYVPHLEGKALTVIERAQGTSRAIVSGGAFSGAEVSPDGREVWAVEHENRRIHVIATAKDQPLTVIPLESDDFARLQFAPDGRHVYLVAARTLRRFDAAARRQTGRLDMPRAGKVLAIDPSGTRAAISHPSDNNVTIVDLEKMAVVSTFAVGATPDGVAWVK